METGWMTIVLGKIELYGLYIVGVREDFAGRKKLPAPKRGAERKTTGKGKSLPIVRHFPRATNEFRECESEAGEGAARQSRAFRSFPGITFSAPSGLFPELFRHGENALV